MDEVIEKVKGKSEALHLKLDVTLLKNAAKSMFVISMGPNVQDNQVEVTVLGTDTVKISKLYKGKLYEDSLLSIRMLSKVAQRVRMVFF